METKEELYTITGILFKKLCILTCSVSLTLNSKQKCSNNNNDDNYNDYYKYIQQVYPYKFINPKNLSWITKQTLMMAPCLVKYPSFVPIYNKQK